MLKDARFAGQIRAAKMEGELRAELRKKLAPIPSAPATSHLSAATTLLERRREMFEVQQSLEAQKSEYSRFEDIMKRRENDLESKDVKLQEQLVRLNPVLQTNASQKDKADAKIALERKEQEQLVLKQKQLRDELDRIKEEKEHINLKLERKVGGEVVGLRRFKLFMEKGVESSELFTDTSAIQKRYEALENSKKELEERLAMLQRDRDSLRDENSKLMHAAEQRVLIDNKELLDLRKRAEEMGIHVEDKLREAEEKLRRQREEKDQYAQIIQAIEHLFRRTCECSRIARISAEVTLDAAKFVDAEKMLAIISDFVTDLQFGVDGVIRKRQIQAMAMDQDNLSDR